MTDEIGVIINGDSNANPQSTGLFGVRYVQVILGFFLIAIAYDTRINLSVAIVAMTDNTTSPNPNIPTYNWNNKSTILSSFFWGYVVTQIFAGIAGKRYGIRWFLVGTMLINSIACLLTPLIAEKFGSTGVIVCRVLQGLSQGFVYPSLHNLLGKWAPPRQRSVMATFIFSGGPFGTITAMSATGLISASWLGWPVAFYIHGAVGVLWVVIWLIYGANSPAEHKRISAEERFYIENELGQLEQKQLSTPWRAIFASLPFWAILIAHSGHNWGYTMLLTEIPNYMNKIMKFDMNQNSLISAIPYLAMWVLSYVFGALSDVLINRQYVSREIARKINNTIGAVAPALALIAINYVPDGEKVLVVAILTLAVGINSAIFTGFQVNHVDLSPNHAGVLMGITNCVSNIFSILGPLAVQLIVSDENDQSSWQIVFFIASAAYIVSGIFYVIFAKGDVQNWNDYDGNCKSLHKLK